MSLKQQVRRWMARMGYTVYKTDFLPFGLDVGADIRRFVGSGDAVSMILDVGAHQGETAHYFAAAFPQAAIHSFEPTAASYQNLVTSCAKLPNVRAWNLALGDEPGRCTLLRRANSQENSIVRAQFAEGGGAMEDAPITTITHWAHENRVAKIDVLKTDTEGYDLRVLRGAAELLAAKTVTFVLSEVTFVPNEKFQTQFHELFTYLDSRDYGFVDIYDHCFERMAWPRVPPVSFANALFCVRDFAARMSMSGR